VFPENRAELLAEHLGDQIAEVTRIGGARLERTPVHHDASPGGPPARVDARRAPSRGDRVALRPNPAEAHWFDPETGACLTSDFLDYKMATAVEMPRSIESIFIESDEPSGPFGAKSLSEPCVIVPAPAIANAIFNAVGVRVRDLPITPEKILAGLGKL